MESQRGEEIRKENKMKKAETIKILKEKRDKIEYILFKSEKIGSANRLAEFQDLSVDIEKNYIRLHEITQEENNA
jgi:hypothetical protein